MLLLFAAVFAVAVNFSILFFLTFPGDREANSNGGLNRTMRPFYLIVIAIAFWAMSYPALVSPDVVTTVYPSYTIQSNSVANGNTLYTFGAFNVITNNNSPVPVKSFYAYLPLWVTVLLVHLIVLVMYILEYTSDKVEDYYGPKSK